MILYVLDHWKKLEDNIIPILSNSTNIYYIKCRNSSEAKKNILYSIRTIYKELDFAFFLFRKKKILKKCYIDSLDNETTLKSFEAKYTKLFLDFGKIFNIYRYSYESSSINKIIGRVGELLTFFIFRKKNKKSLNQFNRTLSNIFESGIDFFRINYSFNKKKFEYYFFETKTTVHSVRSQISKINKWYSIPNFIKKMLFEFDKIENNIKYNQNFSQKEKILIIADLENLINDLISDQIPSDNFFFCSCIFLESNKDKSNISIKRDNLLRKGYDFIFQINDFIKNIEEAYSCLNITI